MNFLILQHLAIEGPELIGVAIRNAGHNIHTVELWHESPSPDHLRDSDGLIIMGGPLSATDEHLEPIRICLAMIEQALKDQLPMLGICLGAQLIARTAGGNIKPSPVRELGWLPVYPSAESDHDPLFKALPGDGLTVFQWHGESFTLPASATLLASHPEVTNQAFRLACGQYGLQFHVEVDAASIDDWIKAGDSERAYLGKAGIAELQAATPIYLQSMQDYCQVLMQA
ncbi:MAG: type 1 glutamine amidotransferase, partial [Mariprofundaceae bacterium]